MIRAIAAIDDKRGIAVDDRPPHGIPWDIPEDKAYYRTKTSGSIIIMGHNTYGPFRRPLPDRRNIVASHTLKKVGAGFELISNLEAFLLETNEDIWIIGGAELYRTALKYCQELYLTHVEGDFNCDRFFPTYDNFMLKEKSPVHEQNGHRFYYAIYEKPVSA